MNCDGSVVRTDEHDRHVCLPFRVGPVANERTSSRRSRWPLEERVFQEEMLTESLTRRSDRCWDSDPCCSAYQNGL